VVVKVTKSMTLAGTILIHNQDNSVFAQQKITDVVDGLIGGGAVYFNAHILNGKIVLDDQVTDQSW